jgi:hypothetical protein
VRYSGSGLAKCRAQWDASRMPQSLGFAGCLGGDRSRPNRPECRRDSATIMSLGRNHAPLLDAAICFGRRHILRQHNEFHGLFERRGPSLRELGARMCSTVGRWDKTLQALHAPASSDQGLPGG